MTAQCTKIKANGERCRTTWALNEEGLCATHDPSRDQARRAVERAVEVRRQRRDLQKAMLPGGMPRRGLRNVDDCVRWGAWVAWAVAVGSITEGRARQIVSAINATRESLKVRDLEREAAELRAQVKDLMAQTKRPGALLPTRRQR